MKSDKLFRKDSKMNTVIITLRTSEDGKQKLDNLALEDNRRLNNLINTILLKYLESKEKVGN